MDENTKETVLLMRHLGFSRKQIQQELGLPEHPVAAIINEHVNRDTSETRERKKLKRRRYRRNRESRKRVPEQQQCATTGGLPTVDRGG